MRKRERHHSDRAFIDLLFNCLLGFVFLFIISFMMVEIEKKKANITTKAEYVITTTWDLNNPDDVDTWLRDPAGNVAWFRKKDKGLMHLDRDDLGSQNDTFTLPDGTEIKYPYNQEIVTIRGFVPGEWVLNIHMYNKKSYKPAHVEIKMEKLNPSVKTVFLKQYTIEQKALEITVARFIMSAAGDIISMSEEPTSLVEEEIMNKSLSQGIGSNLRQEID